MAERAQFDPVNETFTVHGETYDMRFLTATQMRQYGMIGVAAVVKRKPEKWATIKTGVLPLMPLKASRPRRSMSVWKQAAINVIVAKKAEMYENISDADMADLVAETTAEVRCISKDAFGAVRKHPDVLAEYKRLTGTTEDVPSVLDLVSAPLAAAA